MVKDVLKINLDGLEDKSDKEIVKIEREWKKLATISKKVICEENRKCYFK